MSYKELNDYELLSLVSEDEEATDILFKKYRPLIVNKAKKLYDENKNYGIDLNDLIQEGMIGFSKAINTYNDKDAIFFTYARKCIEGKMLSLLKTANRQKHLILNNSISMEAIEENDNYTLDTIIVDTKSSPEDIIIENENVKDLLKRISKDLTAIESEVFELKKSGFDYKEISEILDITPKQVDNAIQRIKNKIKNYKK